MSAKRALFTTPSSRTKRRKATPRSKPRMSIPRSLLPETKQFSGAASVVLNTNVTCQQLTAAMTQGDRGDEFSGSKWRMLRMRIFYDFSQLSLTEGVRMSVVIPKDPNVTPSLTSAIAQWDTRSTTVLFDRLVGDDTALVTGTFDVVGPINVELNQGGTGALRNNIWIYFHSANSGTAMSSKNTFSVWYTDV